MSFKHFKESIDYALSSLSAQSTYIFIEQLVFMDGKFWLKFRLGSSLKVHAEPIEVLDKLYDSSSFNAIQYAKFQRYKGINQVYHEFIKRQCPEAKSSYISYVLREVQNDA
ncbi:hypothetical protein JQC92_01665 [Shewanella sp. 202IG2-18]|uniref:hypothetical protein n=1 Tax=Parashewanella hymeniacidonis TaxID=2807618 RepID=UPI00195FF3C0|nr:hypothetical protein [Parashewanella hymeniacidonis]MBM7070750.1 hypothetical protein [Parashewanella hymeniacidonis]